jgi:type IV pilus assembly protein PilC
MTLFRFEAMNAQGQTVKSDIEAASEEEAIRKIRAQKLFPTSVREKTPKGAAVQPRRKNRRTITIGGVTGKDLTTFTRQLSTLQVAGLPIVRSLKILESQQKPGALKNVLGQLAEDVEGGMSFSEALARHPRAFDALYVNMVRAGETGGVLDAILQRLADFREKSQRLKKRVVGAMIYPAAVVLVASGILTGIMAFIVPKFKKMFDEFGMPLPVITQMLINFSDFVARRWYWGIGFVAAVVICFKLMKATPGGRYIVDKIRLRVPVFGPVLSKAVMARLTRTLGTLVAAGVPILEALNITRNTAGNAVVARAVGHVHDSIREGESIAPPLSQTGICDEMVVHMVDVGEETGELDKMLLMIADQYDEDVDVAVAGMTGLIEPTMIIFLGGAVGFIVIALFFPLIRIMSGGFGG